MSGMLTRRVSLVLVVLCTLVIFAGCASSTTRMPTQSPIPHATTSVAANASIVPCASTPPAALVVTDGSNVVMPSTTVPYQQAGYCKLLFIVTEQLGVGWNGKGNASAVLAITYEESVNNVQRNVTVFAFLDGGKVFTAEPSTVQCGGSSVPVQPLFMSVFYPGTGDLTPHLLPKTLSGGDITEGLSEDFGLPTPPDRSLSSALCAQPAGI